MSVRGEVHEQYLERYAEQLYRARVDVQPIPPLTETDPELTIEDAYAIQQGLVRRLEADGGEVVGYKLGLTSAPMQQMLGVDTPDYGPVLSTMVHDDRAVLRVDDHIQPRIEAEIALVLTAPLAGPGVRVLDAARAVGSAVAALELVDSRIEEWRIGLIDTVADLASCAQIVLGSREVPTDGLDVRLTGMVVHRNGELIDTGAGAAALGDPIAAVAWLANTLAPYGVTLEPGHVVMTGALHRAFAVEAGDRIVATFDRLGAVSCRFT
jgi:2-keto-4-pentenoate hydratase